MDIDDIVLNMTYVMYVIAPMIREELRLRIVLAIASVGFAIWATMIDSQWTLIWNIVFLILSLYNIARILRERQPLELTADKEHIRVHLFPEMTTRQFERFWTMADDYHASEQWLTKLGEPVEYFWIFLSGDVTVDLSDERKAMDPGSTIGGMSYVMGEDVVATASVFAKDAELRRWSKAALKNLAATDPELNAPFLSGIGRGLVSKIRS